MRLVDILQRVEARMDALGLSALSVGKMSGKKYAIYNLRRAVTSGQRRGISTATLDALAPVLKVSVEWLLTGEEGNVGETQAGENHAVTVFSSATLTVDDAVAGFAWTLEDLGFAPSGESHVLARAVVRAIRRTTNPDGSPMSEEDRRALIREAIQLFRPE